MARFHGPDRKRADGRRLRADCNAYLVPGVLVAFLAGILQANVTATGSFACILTGPIASVLLERGALHGFDHNLQAFHRPGLAALVSYVVLMGLSLVYRHERGAEAQQYLWWRYRHGGDDERSIQRAWWQRDGLWAILLAVLTLALCWYFARGAYAHRRRTAQYVQPLGRSMVCQFAGLEAGMLHFSVSKRGVRDWSWWVEFDGMSRVGFGFDT